MIRNAFTVINAFRLMEMCKSALRPFEYHLRHINLTLPVLLESLIVNIDLLSPYLGLIYEVVNRRVLPWRDMLFAVPLACVLNSWSFRYKPLRWTHPAPPPPLWACVCVCVKTWQRKELNSGSLGEWLQSRLISAQVIAHAYGRVISGCLEPAGGQGSPLALTNTAKCNNDIKWLSQH